MMSFINSLARVFLFGMVLGVNAFAAPKSNKSPLDLIQSIKNKSPKSLSCPANESFKPTEEVEEDYFGQSLLYAIDFNLGELFEVDCDNPTNSFEIQLGYAREEFECLGKGNSDWNMMLTSSVRAKKDPEDPEDVIFTQLGSVTLKYPGQLHAVEAKSSAKEISKKLWQKVAADLSEEYEIPCTHSEKAPLYQLECKRPDGKTLKASGLINFKGRLVMVKSW